MLTDTPLKSPARPQAKEQSSPAPTFTSEEGKNALLSSQVTWALRLPKGTFDQTAADYRKALTSILSDMRPQDEFERILQAHMLAVHNAVMDCFYRASNDDDPDFIELWYNKADQLMSRYVKQLEALNKHRGRGMPQVHVERVNVEAGGQAVVGAVQTRSELAQIERPQKGVALEHQPVGDLEIGGASPITKGKKGKRRVSA